MKKYVLPMLGLGAIASPAIATPTITFSTGTAIPSYTTAQVFESFEGQATVPASSTTGEAFDPSAHASSDVSIGQTESATGARIFSAPVPGVAADTDTNSSNKFLSVLGGTTYTVSFASPVQFFSFILGSLDSYNQLALTTSDGMTTTYNGAAIVNQMVTFNSNGNSSLAGRVNYDFGGGAGLTTAVFSSTRDSFEIDQLAAAVPEAATWAMMMVGLGVVGGSLRRRRNVATRVAFA